MKKFVRLIFLLNLSFILFACDQLATDGSFSYAPKQTKQSRWELSSYIFDLESLPTITIEITTDNWNTILTNYDANDKNEDMVIADLTFQKNGKTDVFKNIGFRIRGNLSRRRPEGNSGELHNSSNPDWHHAHFKVSFAKFTPEGTEFYGLKGLNLKWFKDDGAYVREIYCYDLFQRFGVWTAPRASYVKLYIKIKEDTTPAYFGVYEILEAIDKKFLQARFTNSATDDNGFLWKCLWGANLTINSTSGNNIGIEYHSISSNYTPPYDLKTELTNFDNAKSQLVLFIQNLNNKTGADFQNWLEQNFDVDLFLRAYAVNVLVGMWDDYWKDNGNNYYLYFDDKGKAYFIPYDYDNTLGASMVSFGNMGSQNVINWGPLDSDHPLITKILSVPEYLNRYKNYLAVLINRTNDYFDFVNSTNRIQKWVDMIRSYVPNDTGEDNVWLDSLTGTWTDYNFYRLLSGNISDTGPDANYFKTRIVYAQLQLGLPTNNQSWEDGGGGAGDSTPPEWLTEYPRVGKVYPYYGTFYFGMNESGKVYYVIQTNALPAPTPAEVKAGQAGGGGTPFFAQTADVTGGNTYEHTIMKLTPTSDYTIYLVGEDNANNLQLSVTNICMNTPEVSYNSTEGTESTIIFRYLYDGESTPSTNVYLRGDSPIGWDPGLAMTNVVSNMYVLELTKNSQVNNGNQYKFYYNNTYAVWITDPQNPSNLLNNYSNSVVYW